MKYCTRCIIPDSRPNILLDSEGVCNACRNFETKQSIDWSIREQEFQSVVRMAKAANAAYDCIVPVSGGKDSHWQIITCLERGLHPLALSWKPPARTEIGRQNLENLIRLGVDHVDISINPRVERDFMLAALRRCGSTAVPMHMAIFALPLRYALNFHIPLIVWGENSAVEYGHREESELGFKMDSSWVKRYGVTHGTTAADWISDKLSRTDLEPYFAPNEAELDARGVLAVFLGHYFRWDPEESFRVAALHGFQKGAFARTGTYAHTDIDDVFISIHHYLKWYKFGFTRSFDNLSLEIRNGRTTRKEAISSIREGGDPTPREDISALCDFLEIEESQFFEIIEGFRNTDIWKKERGTWKIPDFIVPDYEWT